MGEQPTFAKQITKLHNKRKQTSKSKSKEPQLPSKSKGRKYGTRFQGQLRFPGKLGMCPSLAEPDIIGFPKSNVSHETLHKNCTCSNETGAMNLFFEKPTAYGSAESLRYLPSCCSPVVALPELVMNLS